MKCRICGRQDARIRLCELKTARITKRAHVDCNGHSEYRSLTVAEIDLVLDCEAYKPNAPAEAPAIDGRLGPDVGCSECSKMREYIRDHVHAFIDSDEIDRLMSYEEWCQLDAPNAELSGQ